MDPEKILEYAVAIRELASKLIKDFKEIKKENKGLKAKCADLVMENESLKERILDLEACK